MDPWQFALILVVALVVAPLGLVAGAALLRRSGLLVSGTSRNPLAPTPPTAPAAGVSPAELAEMHGELNAVRAEWKAHQKQLDAYLDAFEDLEESVERRRRRAASSRSKAEAAQQEEAAPPMSPREEARMRARARGFRV